MLTKPSCAFGVLAVTGNTVITCPIDICACAMFRRAKDTVVDINNVVMGQDNFSLVPYGMQEARGNCVDSRI